MSSIAADNATMPKADFGDLQGEFQALTSRCGVYEVVRRAKLQVTGRDRVRWLNGMVTNNIRDLAVGHAVYCFLLNPQGHILGDLYVYNRGESFLIDTDESQVPSLLPILRRYIIMDQVEIADISLSLNAIGISGPKARAVLTTAGFDLPELQPLQLTEVTWRGASVTVVHGDNPAADSNELWVAPENVRSLWDGIVDANAKPVRAAVLELFRIAAGMPRYGQDIRERDLPQETGQVRALNFSKGCYIGQEIVERIRTRGNVHRVFTGFDIQGPVPEGHTKIQAEGKDIGEITSTAVLPTLRGDRPVALGFIRREFATPGTQVQAAGAQLMVATVPFSGIFDHEDVAH